MIGWKNQFISDATELLTKREYIKSMISPEVLRVDDAKLFPKTQTSSSIYFEYTRMEWSYGV